jgi:putative membrane protein
MSVLPTIPAAWLTLADGVVYKAYDIHYRLFGISAVTDQQLAGLFMKLGVGVYLWTLIFILFFKWAMRNEEAERKGRTVTEREILTWDEVKTELDRLEQSGPAPHEP